MANTKTEQVITESTKTYPRGRGKILVISEKAILPKPKLNNKKPNPSFLHVYIKSNPQDIKVKEYMQEKNRKRIIIFPEKRILDYQERMDLGCAFLTTCSLLHRQPHTRGTLVYRNSTVSKKQKFVFTNEMREKCEAKMKRYEKWRNKIQD